MIVLASRGVKRVRLDRGVVRNHPTRRVQRFLERPVRRLRAPIAPIRGHSDPRSAVRTAVVETRPARKITYRSCHAPKQRCKSLWRMSQCLWTTCWV